MALSKVQIGANNASKVIETGAKKPPSKVLNKFTWPPPAASSQPPLHSSSPLSPEATDTAATPSVPILKWSEAQPQEPTPFSPLEQNPSQSLVPLPFSPLNEIPFESSAKALHRFLRPIGEEPLPAAPTFGPPCEQAPPVAKESEQGEGTEPANIEDDETQLKTPCKNLELEEDGDWMVRMSPEERSRVAKAAALAVQWESTEAPIESGESESPGLNVVDLKLLETYLVKLERAAIDQEACSEAQPDCSEFIMAATTIPLEASREGADGETEPVKQREEMPSAPHDPWAAASQRLVIGVAALILGSAAAFSVVRAHELRAGAALSRWSATVGGAFARGMR